MESTENKLSQRQRSLGEKGEVMVGYTEFGSRAVIVLIGLHLLGCGSAQTSRNEYQQNKREAERENRRCLQVCDATEGSEVPVADLSDPRPHKRAETCRLRCSNELTEKRTSVPNPEGEPSAEYLERRAREQACKLECSETRDRRDRHCSQSNGADQFVACLDTSDRNAERCSMDCKEDRDPMPRRPDAPPPTEPGGSSRHISDVSQKECVDENSGWPVLISENVPGLAFHGVTTPHPEARTWTIQFRPDAAMLSVAMQRFLFAHECGHVNTALAPPQEITANCWAAKRLARLRAMTTADWEEVHAELVHYFPFPTGPYPSGEEQFARIMQCAR